MKRTGLKRKTGLKRTGFSRKRKKGIRPLNPRKAAQMEEYRLAVKAAPKVCAACGATGVPLEPHHYKGRGGGKYLLEFAMVCPELHNFIHHVDPNWAYAAGWLQPEYRGNVRRGDEPRPWEKPFGTLTCKERFT